MPIKLTLNIDNTADLMASTAYGTAARAIIERGTAVAGPYSVAGTAMLVSGTTQYEWWDAVGTTASWYQFRISDSGGTALSAYSDPFRATALAAYGTLDDLLERLNLPDESRYNLLSDLLVAASAQLDTEAGRQFYRIPQVDGTTTRYYDSPGGSVLRLPEGCTSLTEVAVASQTGGAYTTLGTAEWRLRPSDPEPGWPYTELVLTDLATTSFAAGFDTIKLTGVFGWSTVPGLVKEAVIQMAQQMYNRSQTADTGLVGTPELGTLTLPSQRPDAWYRALRAFGRRRGAVV